MFIIFTGIMSTGIDTVGPSTSAATGGFGPPQIPDTPSNYINRMLRDKCDRKFDVRHKFVAAQAACFIIQVGSLLPSRLYTLDYCSPIDTRIYLYLSILSLQGIVLLYSRLHPQPQPSKQMWMASCGIVAAGACIVTSLAYIIIVSSAPIIHTALYYSALSLALAGVGFCVAAVALFDKDQSQFSQGFEAKKD